MLKQSQSWGNGWKRAAQPTDNATPQTISHLLLTLTMISKSEGDDVNVVDTKTEQIFSSGAFFMI